MKGNGHTKLMICLDDAVTALGDTKYDFGKREKKSSNNVTPGNDTAPPKYKYNKSYIGTMMMTQGGFNQLNHNY